MITSTELPKRYLTPNEAAEYLGMKPGTLAVWRHRRTGPRFYRSGVKLVRYLQEDLDAWMEKGSAE